MTWEETKKIYLKTSLQMIQRKKLYKKGENKGKGKEDEEYIYIKIKVKNRTSRKGKNERNERRKTEGKKGKEKTWKRKEIKHVDLLSLTTYFQSNNKKIH